MKPQTNAPSCGMRRSIPLLPASLDKLAVAAASLRNIEAVCEIWIEDNCLRICYDASCMGLGDIERLLDEAGIQRATSLGWRLKSAWYRFLDSNARSKALPRNAACCGRSPSPRS